MKVSRALILSIIISLGLSLLLQSIFGVKAFGLFLFLPLSFLLVRNRSTERQTKEHDRSEPDSGPIEPK
jgi:hypothetical protein